MALGSSPGPWGLGLPFLSFFSSSSPPAPSRVKDNSSLRVHTHSSHHHPSRALHHVGTKDGDETKLPLHNPDPSPKEWEESGPSLLLAICLLRSWGTTYSEDVMCIILAGPLKMTIPRDSAMMSQVLKHCHTQLLGLESSGLPSPTHSGEFLPLSSLSPFLLSLPYRSSRDHSCLFSIDISRTIPHST